MLELLGAVLWVWLIVAAWRWAAGHPEIRSVRRGLRHAAGFVLGVAVMTLAIPLQGIGAEPGEVAGWWGLLLSALAVAWLEWRIARHKRASGQGRAVRRPGPQGPSKKQARREAASAEARRREDAREEVQTPADTLPDGEWPDADEWISLGTGSVVEFTYRKSSGEQAERQVQVRQVKGRQFRGYCLKAGGLRTFRADRVVSPMVDVDTGEALSPLEWCRAAHGA
jgi:hypothetical protein